MTARAVPFLVLTLALATALAGCSAGSQQGATQGAKTGAVGGMVAGAVGSIFWGGDPVNNALRAGAVGAASGAAVGAMSSGNSTPATTQSTTPTTTPAPPAPAPPVPAAAQAQSRPLSASDAALEARIGAANFAAGEELAQCRHVGAIARAQRAFTTETDPGRREYSLLIQAMAAEESGNASMADAVYAQWGQVDPAFADANKARAAALDGILKVQRIRQEHGLPVLCS